jgi:hypothetical protein
LRPPTAVAVAVKRGLMLTAVLLVGLKRLRAARRRGACEPDARCGL